MSKASNAMTEHAENAEATYKPSEHGGMRKDGEPDQRMSSEHGAALLLARSLALPGPGEEENRRLTIPWLERLATGFGGDKELAHDAGVKGGKATQEDIGFGGPLDVQKKDPLDA